MRFIKRWGGGGMGFKGVRGEREREGGFLFLVLKNIIFLLIFFYCIDLSGNILNVGCVLFTLE